MGENDFEKKFNAAMERYRNVPLGGVTTMENKTPPPDGNYRCLAKGHYIRPVQEGKKPYLALTHTVIEGNFVGAVFYQDIYATVEALWISFPFFQALGLTDFAAIESANIVDWVCDVTVETETLRTGKERQVVTNLAVIEKSK